MDNFDFTEVFPKSVKVEKAKMAEFDEKMNQVSRALN